MRFEITTPATTDPVSLAIAPDGRSLVFVGSADGLSRLWMRRLDSNTPHQLIGTEHASLPFWAPDSRSVGFFADGKIKRIDLESGLVRSISTAAVPAGAAWNAEGVILHALVPDSPLFQTSVAGSPLAPATQLASGQTGHRGPAFFPDGRHFLFYAMGSPTVRGIHVGELGTTVVRRLLDADTPAVFAPPDHLLYLQGSTLFIHRVDPTTFMLLGEPMALADGIASEAGAGLPAISASATGTIVYRTGSAGGQRQFIWFDRAGKELSRIGTPEAEQILIQGLLAADVTLRHRVVASLNKLRDVHPDIKIDPSVVELLLAAEIAGHYRSYQVLGPLRAQLKDDDPVLEALRHSMEQEIERIFRVMALLLPQSGLHDAYVGLRSANPIVRANALEFLDNVLKPELRQVLVPLLDSHVTTEERIQLANRFVGAPLDSAERAVATLLASEDGWLRSCAVYAVGALQLRNLAPQLRRFEDSDDPVLRQSVSNARRRLAGETVPAMQEPAPPDMDLGVGAG